MYLAMVTELVVKNGILHRLRNTALYESNKATFSSPNQLFIYVKIFDLTHSPLRTKVTSTINSFKGKEQQEYFMYLTTCAVTKE